jgi:hypothetical protein
MSRDLHCSDAALHSDMTCVLSSQHDGTEHDCSIELSQTFKETFIMQLYCTIRDGLYDLSSVTVFPDWWGHNS